MQKRFEDGIKNFDNVKQVANKAKNRCAVTALDFTLVDHGEAAFREVEAKVAKEIIAPKTGLVVATGGGAVLRDDNVFHLRLNGKLYFIDRPLEQLCATADRPTANSDGAIRKRYEERYDRYCHTCDRRIVSDGVADHVAHQIIKDFVK